MMYSASPNIRDFSFPACTQFLRVINETAAMEKYTFIVKKKRERDECYNVISSMHTGYLLVFYPLQSNKRWR